jgi:hypothetical protein
MIKSLGAFEIFAVLGASGVALPWFAPQAEAGETLALAKSDRLEVRSLSAELRQTNLAGLCRRVFAP